MSSKSNTMMLLEMFQKNTTLLMYSIITVLIDIFFVSVIFRGQKEGNKTGGSPKSKQIEETKAVSSLRWGVVVFRYEKSPFIILSIYSLLCGIIAFALICVFTINLFMAQTLDTIDHSFDFFHKVIKKRHMNVYKLLNQQPVYDLIEDVVLIIIMIYFAVFFTGYIAIHCISILWYNHADVCKLFVVRLPFQLNVFAAHFCRMSHLLITIIFVIIKVGVNDTHNMNETVRIFCQWMALQGLLWVFIYFMTCSFIAVYIGYKIRKEQLQQSTKKTNSIEVAKIIRRPYPTDLFDGCITLYFLSKCTQYYELRQNYVFIQLCAIFLFYTIIKYCKWYGPIWQCMFSWFTGKNRRQSRFTGIDNFLDYWKIIRNKIDFKKKTRRKHSGRCCPSCSMNISFMVIVLVTGIAINQFLRFMPHSNTDDMDNDDSESDSNVLETNHFKLNQDYSAYPICDIKFGNDANLTVLDLTILTMVPYKSTRGKHEAILDQWFGKKKWGKYVKFVKKTPSFIHIFDKAHHYDIIAVRGTKDRHDKLQDLSLFTEVASLQLISFFLPLTSFLPDEFLRDFVDITNYDIRVRAQFDKPVYDYISNHKRLKRKLSKSNSYGHSIYVLGHSLGGGIAEIVAAKFATNGYKNVISFGLSSPGVALSSKKFAFNITDLDKTSISVIPRRDIVPKVDRHGGFKQLISCSQTLFADCHLAWSSFCELKNSCSSKYTRNSTLADCICTYRSGWGGIPQICFGWKKKKIQIPLKRDKVNQNTV